MHQSLLLVSKQVRFCQIVFTSVRAIVSEIIPSVSECAASTITKSHCQFKMLKKTFKNWQENISTVMSYTFVALINTFEPSKFVSYFQILHDFEDAFIFADED